jgi:PLD-like domain
MDHSIFRHWSLLNTIVVNLPHIHAKVYIADTSFALVTSANLTPSGMGTNFEYGIGIDDSSTVNGIRKDLQSYAQLGNILDLTTLSGLITVTNEVSTEFRKIQRQTNSKFRKQITEKLRTANYEFLRAQVGNRSAHALFSEAILYLLSLGPLPTKELHPRIQNLLPDLCDDSSELIINGQHFGKKWKHSVRNAQQYLKRTSQIKFDGRFWKLNRP